MYTVDLMQKLQLLDGTFTPREAKDVTAKLINDQINFYKLKNLNNFMKDHCNDQCDIDEKIERLKQTKLELEGLISEARAEGCKLKIVGEFSVILDK